MKRIALFSLLSLLFSSGIVAMASREKDLLDLLAYSGLTNFDQVAALIDAGVDVDIRDHQRNTPLHLTVLKAHDERSGKIAKELISAGADVNVRNTKGDTPLHWAAFASNIPAIMALISAGAHVNVKNHEGKTPLDYAVGQEAKQLLQDEIKKQEKQSMRN